MFNFVGFFTNIIQLLFGTWLKQTPQEVIEASKTGAATEALNTEGAALSELENASNARADASTQRLRNDPTANNITSDPTAPINTDPNGYFRD